MIEDNRGKFPTTVSVRVPVEMRRAVQKRADADGTSMHELCRRAIASYLAERPVDQTIQTLKDAAYVIHHHDALKSLREDVLARVRDEISKLEGRQ